MANPTSRLSRLFLWLCLLLPVLSPGPETLCLASDQVGLLEGSDISGTGAQVSPQCNTNIMSFLPPPYGNLSNMVCMPVWNTFVLRYSQNNEYVVSIILSALYTTGWVGIGFSKDGTMVGSSAMVGWVNKKGNARISQYYLQGKEDSLVIAGKGELPLTNIPTSVVLRGASIYLAFQLQFNARLAQQPIILAFGSAIPKHNHLSHHDDKTAFNLDFSAGSMSAPPDDIGQMKKNHGILGIVGWGLILPVGAIVPRYFKHKDPLWYYLHFIIQLLGFVVGLAAVLLGRQLYNKINAEFPTHRGIGIFVLVISILQTMAFFLRPNKDSKIRRYWNWYHHWFGRIALFLGALNIVLGIQIGGAGNEWKIGYGFLLSVVLVSVVILEALSWMKKSEKAAMNPNFEVNQ